jgi:hypothetical protein
LALSAAAMENEFPRIKADLTFLLFAFDCSKKKLIQQRSQQTSDRPSIPNILMMPITKANEKSDQYAAE